MAWPYLTEHNMNDELQGTFACSVCGVAEPHWHDVALINRRRVEEGVLRPAFESALFDLMPRMQELRVSAYGMRHKCFQKLGTGRETLELPKEYFDAKVEAMWQLFLRAHYAASAGVAPSDEAQRLRAELELIERISHAKKAVACGALANIGDVARRALSGGVTETYTLGRWIAAMETGVARMTQRQRETGDQVLAEMREALRNATPGVAPSDGGQQG